MDVSAAEEIEQIEMGAPHVVLLGAGASRAALPAGDAHGRRLPVMSDFVDIVPVGPILDGAGVPYRGRGFEEVYSGLCQDASATALRLELESVIDEYFASLSLPDEPTLYDHLVLALRHKDAIATFNWDPFLLQAARRNGLTERDLPSILFLHGNVAAGFCPLDNIHGQRGAICSRCGRPFEPYPLLYPVATKSYDEDPALRDAWRAARLYMQRAFWVTIFGYGAPTADATAVQLLLDAWGGGEARKMEEFELIDIRPEDELTALWDRFIYSHHYQVHLSVYDSWLFSHPRRSGEAYINTFLNARFTDENPIPRYATFGELWQWFAPLLERERRDKDPFPGEW